MDGEAREVKVRNGQWEARARKRKRESSQRALNKKINNYKRK
jgi:hypothetical protein